MFKKVHLRLTLLCVGTTALIMIIMSLSYLYISERGLNRNQFLSFRNDMNTFYSNLEQQPVITYNWLSQMKGYNHYIIQITDNGVPFLFNELDAGYYSDNTSILVQEALSTYNDSLSPSSGDLVPNQNGFISEHTEFEFTSASTGKNYYGSITHSGGENLFQVIIISPLDSLEAQIWNQRILFLIINLSALFVLTAFFWVFTWKLLKPIKKSQKSQAAFVSSASHELRTPIAVILSCTENCKNASPDKQGSFVNTIHSEALRMSRLVDEMLTLSQSDNHRFAIEKLPVELDTLLLNFYEAFEPMAKEKSISLSVQLPDFPLSACICDADRIGQVIAILLHNAVSYTPLNGSISLSLTKKKYNFVLSVSDDGLGISDEDKTKIFDRFYRAEKSRNTKGHFGLGLCIAYEIIKSHQGTIKVSDTPGGGTTFTVFLPG